MPDVAICVDGVGKRYQLGANAGMFRYGALRDAVSDTAAAWAGRLRGLTSGTSCRREPADSFWALRDVAFEVPRGQVLGVIGRNGAGKSTLLKILSRVTRPTEGWADLHGRVGSLLEVGTGFHPELSGRDNIYLNGALLGMRRREVAEDFDAIVAFSGVERFLDTPVKRYSSGMYVRLAFAVAAHLRSEILLVDEVLAVGDAEFQRKCLGKMQNIVCDGRTILFVSHNMAAVRSLCQRAVMLDCGRVIADDTAACVVDQYLRTHRQTSESGTIPDGFPRIGTGTARFRSVAVRDPDGLPVQTLYLGQAFRVEAELAVTSPVKDAVIEVGLSTFDGTRVATVFTTDLGVAPCPLEPGRYRVGMSLAPSLLPRVYAIDLGVHHAAHGTTIDLVRQVLDLEVSNVPDEGAAAMFSGEARGFVRPPAQWLGVTPLGAPNSTE